MIKISILGIQNMEILAQEVKKSCLNYLHKKAEVLQVPYGQINQQILNKNSEFWNFNSDISWVCTWLDDFYDPHFNIKVENTILQKYANHLRSIKEIIDHYEGTLCINEPLFLSGLDMFSLDGIQMSCRELFYKFIKENPKIKIISHQSLYLNSLPTSDTRLKMIARINMSHESSTRLANKLIRELAQITGDSIRLIITDLDNTLWGGVIGEDGIDKVMIGGDFPGNCYKAFQSSLLYLKQKCGIILSICSKNDRLLVDKMFSKRKMPLCADDFTLIKANWKKKYINIQEIASEIGFRYQNILFIDDSPLESSSVKHAIPDLNVIHLSSDPTLLINQLSEFPLLPLEKNQTQQIDRNNDYKKRIHFMNDMNTHSNIESFYQSLNLEITLEPVNKSTALRCSELLSKTTQFNLTMKRYSSDQLIKLNETHSIALSIEVSDKYSDKEVMGVIIIKKDNEALYKIDNFVLSCRALGKHVESESLIAILKNVLPNGASLIGQVLKTDRNIPAQNIFKDMGFYFDSSKDHWISCSKNKPEQKKWANTIVKNNDLITV